MENLERLTIRGSGLNLAADSVGPAGAPSVLFLHGSGQTRQSWGSALDLTDPHPPTSRAAE